MLPLSLSVLRWRHRENVLDGITVRCTALFTACGISMEFRRPQLKKLIQITAISVGLFVWIGSALWWISVHRHAQRVASESLARNILDLAKNSQASAHSIECPTIEQLAANPALVSKLDAWAGSFVL